MGKCQACGTFILFGGPKLEGERFCNGDCLEYGRHRQAAREHVNENDVVALARQTHAGPCPACEGSGPVDIHTSYLIWSVVVLTSTSTEKTIACFACAKKVLIKNTIVSALVGWWGFPGGLATPVQLYRNLVLLFKTPQSSKSPSEELKEAIRMSMVSEE